MAGNPFAKRLQVPQDSRRRITWSGRPGPYARRFTLEILEDRCVLAVTATLNGGLLAVMGDGLANDIDLRRNGAQLEVRDFLAVNPLIGAFGLNLITEIEVNAAGGNDQIKINEIGGAFNLDIPTTLIGSDGDDVLIGGQGNELFIGGEGSDQMTGNHGNDTYKFSAAIAGQADFVQEVVGPGEGRDTLDFSELPAIDPVDVDISGTIVGMPTYMASHFQRTVESFGIGGPAGIENIIGGEGPDALVGNQFANDITGGEGSDTMDGRDDNDRYLFGPALVAQTDTITEAVNQGTDLLEFSQLAATDPVTVDLTNDTPQPLAVHANRDVLTSAVGVAAEFENVLGGQADDHITGNDQPNLLDGGPGDDTVNGGVNDDRLVGEVGDDMLMGGMGADRLEGGAGNDMLDGGDGDDEYVFVDATNVELDQVSELAAGGTDLLNFRDVTSDVTAELAMDTPGNLVTHANRVVRTKAAGQAVEFENISCGIGNDVIVDNAANNLLDGGRGSDTYRFGPSAAAQEDVVGEFVADGGAGIDTLDFSPLGNTDPVTVNLTNDTPNALASHTNRIVRTRAAGEAAAIENIIGGEADDILTGNARMNRIEGRGGNDRIFGLDNRDQLLGGSGADTISGGEGPDTLDGGDGGDLMEGNSGDDTYLFQSAAAPQFDVVNEHPAEGNDTLDFSPLAANDPVNVTLGGTLFVVLASHTNRQVITTSTDTTSNLENAKGGAGNDLLQDSAIDNTLQGGPGDDVYRFTATSTAFQLDLVGETAGQGADTLDFGLQGANDPVSVDLTSNAPAILAEQTQRRVRTAPGTSSADIENAIGSAGSDTLLGNAANNRLEGGLGNDQLDGRAGDDLLIGGDGNDVYLFGPSDPGGEDDTVSEAAGAGTGSDTLNFATLGAAEPVSVDLQAVNLATHGNRAVFVAQAAEAANFENAIGGQGQDDLKGNAAVNVLVGGPGNDRLEGRAGSDTYGFPWAPGDPQLGTDSIFEAAGCRDLDVLDFQQFLNQVFVDLGSVVVQAVDLGGVLSVKLSSATGIESLAIADPLVQFARSNGCTNKPDPWTQTGGGPINQAQVIIPPNHPVTGAVEAIAVHPTNPNLVFLGTVNGGIWRSANATNANPTWTALTDSMPSLAIGSIAFSPLNTNHLFAGTGMFSNSLQGGEAEGVYRSTDGGNTWSRLAGATFGGTNQLHIRRIVPTALGANLNAQVVMAATTLERFPRPGTTGVPGIYRSTDGGMTFGRIAAGLPAAVAGSNVGAASDLVADPTNNMTYFAAFPGQGVFRTNDGGMTWARIDNQAGPIARLAGSLNIELAIHNNGGRAVLYLGLIDNNGRIAGVYRDTQGGDGVDQDGVNGVDDPGEYNFQLIGRTGAIASASAATPIRITSAAHGLANGDFVNIAGVVGNNAANGYFRVQVVDANRFNLLTPTGANTMGPGGPFAGAGGTWTLVPNIHTGGQGVNNFAIVADPTNPNLVYVGGDRQSVSPFVGTVFRGNATANSWTSLITTAGPNAGAPHADSRDIVFDSNGTLLHADDGGLYRLTNPAAANFAWSAVIGTGVGAFVPTEFYSAAFDPINNVVIGGTQDVGSPEQSAPGNSNWIDVNQGDGGVAQVDVTNPAMPVRYSSAQFLQGLQRRVFNQMNVLQNAGATFPALAIVGAGGKALNYRPAAATAFDATMQFIQPWALNVVNSMRLLFGTRFLYESSDGGATVSLLGTANVANNLVNQNADGRDNDGDVMIDEGDEFIPNTAIPGLLGANSRYTALVAGGRRNGQNNADLAYVGTANPINNFGFPGFPTTGQLFLRQNRTAPNGLLADFVQVAAYPGGAASFPGGIRDIVVDPNDWQTVYVVDASNQVWRSTDAGATVAGWTNLTLNLAALPENMRLRNMNLRTLEVISSGCGNGEAYADILLVGGLGGVFQLPLRPTGGMAWSRLSTGLPNALVTDLRYTPLGDALHVATMGRGVMTIPRVREFVPPAVCGVLVNNPDPAAWLPAFTNYLQANGLGRGGVAIPAGSGQLQLRSLPWTNITQLKIVFNRDVTVTQNALQLNGVNTANYAFSGFAYDAMTRTATWNVANPLAADRLTLMLAGDGVHAVRDAQNFSVLDGEWLNPTALTNAASDRFTSGDGVPGGNFVFQINVLPGDVTEMTQAVTVADVGFTRVRVGTSTAALGVPPNTYTHLADVDGSGAIDAADVTLVRNRVGTRLPNPPGPGPAPIPVLAKSLPPARVRDLARAVADFSRANTVVAVPAPRLVDLLMAHEIRTAKTHASRWRNHANMNYNGDEMADGQEIWLGDDPTTYLT